MNFILASKSPRRSSILKDIGLEFQIIESGADETKVSKDLPPKLYVQELAMLKSSSVAADAPCASFIIGADTVVVHNGEILGKPKDFDDAYSMLCSLSGTSHEVYTGISVTDSETLRTVTDYCETKVFFSEMSGDEITDYINKYHPYDKAGAYGIQEYAAVFTKRIEGDFFNVVGLPVATLYALLKREFGITI